MSNKKHTDAILDGYAGPFFPPSVDELREQLDSANSPNRVWLRKVASTIHGFVDEAIRPTTQDDYTWFWQLSFMTDSGLVAVLLPWSQDWDKSDGTQSDRGIAIHTQAADETTVRDIVERLILAVRQQVELDVAAALQRV